MPEITVAEFINQMTPGHICPFCGNKQWAFIGERGMLVPNEKGEFNLPSEIDRAFMTECVGCGFVRMIRPYNLIQKVVQAQKQQAEETPKAETKETKTHDKHSSKDKKNR